MVRLQGEAPGRVKTAFTFALAAAVIVVLYWLRRVLLLAFIALLLGILFDSIAGLLMRFARLSRGPAVVLAAVVFLAGVVGAGALIVVPLARQGTQFVKHLPETTAVVQKRLERYERDFPWLSSVLSLPQPGEENKGSKVSTAQVAKRALFTASAVLEAGATALALFFLGLFLAWDPDRWVKGVAELWPGAAVSDRVQLLHQMGRGLKSYLFTVGLYILLMGGAWTLGLWIIGINYPLLFGAIGGLVEIVPYVGPMLGLLPPLLVAFTISTKKVIFVLVLYAILHVLEGYVLVPFLLQRREHLPPPIVILSILLLGELFGTLGVVLAAPLATVAYIWLNEAVYKRHSDTPRLVQDRAA